jgi:16S rRNA (adenine1518-N6/adenine1519-N6)-dimethyltransferase
VRIEPDDERRSRIGDRAFFHDYIRNVFLHRRKLLRGVLTALYDRQVSKESLADFVANARLSENSRAEEMDVETHVRLAESIRDAVNVRQVHV